jgi:hypothetical protein
VAGGPRCALPIVLQQWQVKWCGGHASYSLMCCSSGKWSGVVDTPRNLVCCCSGKWSGVVDTPHRVSCVAAVTSGVVDTPRRVSCVAAVTSEVVWWTRLVESHVLQQWQVKWCGGHASYSLMCCCSGKWSGVVDTLLTVSYAAVVASEVKRPDESRIMDPSWKNLVCGHHILKLFQRKA